MLLEEDVQAGIVVDRTGALRGVITMDQISERVRSSTNLEPEPVAALDEADAPAAGAGVSRHMNGKPLIDWGWIGSHGPRSGIGSSSTCC